MENEYWHGLEISDNICYLQYKQLYDYFTTFMPGTEILGKKP